MNADMVIDLTLLSIGILTAIIGLIMHWRTAKRGNL